MSAAIAPVSESMTGDKRFAGGVARYGSFKTLLLGALAITCVTAVSIASGQSINPLDGDQRSIGLGQSLFGSRCSECHGVDAQGLVGSDLTQLWQSGVSEDLMFDIIRSGVPDTVMPPSAASDNDLWAIIAYLKSISTVDPFVIDDGDLDQGRELFSSRCASCHTVWGTGGSLGPDLSRIGRVRSRERLVAAIRQPSAQIALNAKLVTVVTRDGARISGIRKSEDAFSIQILDVDERLRGFLKTDVDEVIQEDHSLMQESLSDQLTDSELEDLLAFLASLREDPR